jgi:hypothetical protein
MRKLLGRRPSPAMVVACIALLVALGGTSVAAVSQVANNSVGSAQLKSNAVTTPKIKNNAVTAPKIASNAVAAAKIASNAVGSAKIASNAVTGAKIAANAVTSDKVQDGSLAAADFATGVLPAPSNAYARFLNGPVPVASAVTEATSLNIPQAGNYVIFAKAVAQGFGTVTCRLIAGTDTDDSSANVDAASPMPISLLVAHNFTAAGTVSFQCGRSGVLAANVSQIKIAAIGVQSLTNTG